MKQKKMLDWDDNYNVSMNQPKKEKVMLKIK